MTRLLPHRRLRTPHPNGLRASALVRRKCAPGLVPILASLAGLLLASCGSSEEPVLSAGGLELDRSYHDFGEVPHGQRPETRFVLRNRGGRVLHLAQQQSSCSCAEHRFRLLDGEGKAIDRPIHEPPRRLEGGGTLVTELRPGETLELVVRLETMERDPVHKVEEAKTLLRFAEKEIGQILVAYRFVIQPRLVVEPGLHVMASPVRVGQTARTQLTIKRPIGKEPFSVDKIHGLGDRLRLKPLDPIEEGSLRYMVEIGPMREGERGLVRKLEFETDLEGRYRLPLVVSTQVVPELELLGGRAQSFQRFDFSDARHCDLRLRYNGELEDPGFRIEDLRIRSKKGEELGAWFRAEVLHESGKLWTMRLHYKGGASARRFSGSYVLRSRVPRFESQEILVTGFHRPRS